MVISERERMARTALVRRFWPVVRRGMQTMRDSENDGFSVTLLRKQESNNERERYEAVGHELANRLGRLFLWPTVLSYKTILLSGHSTIKFNHVVLRALKHQPRLDREKGRMKVVEIV